MRPVTIRRLLVFGVCAVAVSGLYLAPSIAGAPEQQRPVAVDSPEPPIGVRPSMRQTGHERAAAGSTVHEAGRDRDLTAPAPVTRLEAAELSRNRLTLRWAAAVDNVGVAEYRVSLNGFPVATTSELHASFGWFNDESDLHIVQVVAVDAAGNQSRSTGLLVSRPAASPSAAEPGGQ